MNYFYKNLKKIVDNLGETLRKSGEICKNLKDFQKILKI